jgi:hypothetical protein
MVASYRLKFKLELEPNIVDDTLDTWIAGVVATSSPNSAGDFYAQSNGVCILDGTDGLSISIRPCLRLIHLLQVLREHYANPMNASYISS